MTILKRNGNTMSHLPAFFDDFFNRDLFNWNTSNFSNTNTTIPAVNIKEKADSYEVEVAAPGMNKKDFRVQLDGNLLIISSEKTDEGNNQQESNQQQDNQQQVNKWHHQQPEERYISREFSYQSFVRTFTLQKDVVDADKIQARYEDGVLRLLIPKKEEAKQKPPRMIEIV